MNDAYTMKVADWNRTFRDIRNVEDAWRYIEWSRINVIWTWTESTAKTRRVTAILLVHPSGKTAEWKADPRFHNTNDWDPVVMLPDICMALQLQVNPPPVPQ